MCDRHYYICQLASARLLCIVSTSVMDYSRVEFFRSKLYTLYTYNLRLDPKWCNMKTVLVSVRGIQAHLLETQNFSNERGPLWGSTSLRKDSHHSWGAVWCYWSTGSMWLPGVSSEHINQLELSVVHRVLQFSLLVLRYCMLIYSNCDGQSRAAESRADEMTCITCFPLVIPFQGAIHPFFSLQPFYSITYNKMSKQTSATCI